MIKHLLLFLLISISVTQLRAQCTPNTSITQPGIYPDSATGLSPGVLNQPYNQVLQIRVPTDTSILFMGTPFVVTIDSITLISFTNLPPGITYACNPGGCQFNGGTNGCSLLSGTPSMAGTFHPTAITRTRAHFILGQIPVQIDTINYYTIVIAPPLGIAGNQNYKFELFQNDPNPFNNFTDLKFMVPHNLIATLKVFNLIGKQIMTKSIQCQAGRNIYRIGGDDFSPGVYMYTLSDGITTFTRRMIYSKR